MSSRSLEAHVRDAKMGGLVIAEDGMTDFLLSQRGSDRYSQYESERRTFAQDLINFDKIYSAIVEGRKVPVNSSTGARDTKLDGGFVINGVNGIIDENDTYDEKLAKYAFPLRRLSLPGKLTVYRRMWKISTGFISGVGIRYGPSLIVNTKYQSSAASLIVGERILPQVFIRVADARPIEVQDLCPADMRFKILVFGGDVTVPEERVRLQVTAEGLDGPKSFLHRFGRGTAGGWEVFDVLCFSTARVDSGVDHTGKWTCMIEATSTWLIMAVFRFL